MSQFLTGEALDDKLTSIIWNAKKELIILSPFIRLDNYSKEMFKNYKHNPNLEVVVVFGKNEEDTKKSLPPEDLDFFKQFHNIVIIYCQNLHAKFYANESEGLVTSLNLLGKSMTGNIEYGIAFSKSALSLDKLYNDTFDYTFDVVKNNPCVFVKRPIFKKANLGLTKKFLESKIIYDVTEDLYRNKYFKEKLYNEFEFELLDSDVKISREEFQASVVPPKPNKDGNRFKASNRIIYNNRNKGFCIRCEESIKYDPESPYCRDCYSSWVQWENYTYVEKVCHSCGNNEASSMQKPECYSCFQANK